LSVLAGTAPLQRAGGWPGKSWEVPVTLIYSAVVPAIVAVLSLVRRLDIAELVIMFSKDKRRRKRAKWVLSQRVARKGISQTPLLMLRMVSRKRNTHAD